MKRCLPVKQMPLFLNEVATSQLPIAMSLVHHHTKEDFRNKISHFVQSCEELLIAAARDLAVLNKYDIGAKRIVSLSQACESLAQLTHTKDAHSKQKIGHLCRELLLGIGNICSRAKLIKDSSLRRPVYERFHTNMDQWWRNLGTM